jgi:hypothetical protein
MEWERLNEKIIIASAERLNDGTLNATIQNVGAVTAHLVSLWLSAYDSNGEPQWQHQYNIDIWMSSGETKKDFGQDAYSYTLIEPGRAGETFASVQLPNVGWIYIIKIITERGNSATYILQPPVKVEAGVGVGPTNIGYLVITFNSESLSYTAWENPGYPVTLTSAWEIPNTAQHVIWHVNITNIGSKAITLMDKSHLSLVTTQFESGGGGGFAILRSWYISAPPVAVPPGWDHDHNPDGVPAYTRNQIISPGESAWVAFGAPDIGKPGYYSSSGGQKEIPNMVGEDGEELWLVFVMYYQYGDDKFSQIIPFAAITVL